MSERLQWVGVLVVVSCVGCTKVEETAEAVSSLDGRCDDFICGGNSPTIGDGVVFDELNSDGEPDIHGVRLTGAVYHDGATGADIPVRLTADRDELAAVTLDLSRRYVNGDLLNVQFKLSGPNGDFMARINRVQQTLNFWANDPDPARSDDQNQLVKFYEIVVWRVGQPPDPATPICTQNVSSQPDWGAAWLPVEHSAIAFSGDRYDPRTKTVADEPWGTPWFNLACAGAAPAKMQLMRYTKAGSFVADGTGHYATNVRERQAMLKMFTADYCGTGQAFTVDGQPLTWFEIHKWYNEATLIPPRSWITFEALWDENGAMCLDTPRMANPISGSPITAMDVRKSCPQKTIPSCEGLLTPWRPGAVVATLNPR